MRVEATALLGPRYAGGLSVSAVGDEGALSLQRAADGALSEAEPAPRRPKEPAR